MLSELFKTQERLNILYETFLRDEIRVTEISKDTNTSKGLVSRFLKEMEKEGLLERKGLKYYNKNTSLVKAIKVMLNLNILRWEEVSPPWAQSAALYGSWASGTNTDRSDIDIWIKTDKAPSTEELNQLYNKLSSKTSSDVHILILTPEKLDDIKSNDPPFYNSLMKTSLVLEGEPV